ncbi:MULTISPECIES: DUF3301 domain-containing protein [Pseudoxanthomonas]|uniref:DUF3301 domain-containing protein n=1 Tax=Pseudoxanthomonas winnipegensis TaxID=2480810 RepID=A0AAW8GBQ6_9GAMM|nr:MULTISPECIES: DUF3301 domain-containing protein [Pseudoxanthomonas]MDQ1119799.1 hypothetical protein [Pseudoxanthomonas winnipegensis]MDQ1133000.1 hypothetical protein [Pseudoxanthomonas winnipegensis]MDR6136997.1 hypothetical protein [Pseudoxanthomonas sp. SORGH_AS_0997]RZZ88991.1 DUF3301 domain-containing protein [Pseudoxanthomonas winnipegensis]TAA43854.1 DUF3301 domain-containing protein [Pseudoxanthomonas winnipegensis]
MTPILILIFGAAVFFWWNASRAAAERATQVGRNACEAAGVLWLDQSVQATGVRLRRGEDGRLGLERSFRFDYSHDGVERHTGKMVLHGQRLVSFVGPTRPDNTAQFPSLH